MAIQKRTKDNGPQKIHRKRYIGQNEPIKNRSKTSGG